MTRSDILILIFLLGALYIEATSPQIPPLTNDNVKVFYNVP